MKELKRLEAGFEVVRRATGLTLKIRKVVIAVLTGPFVDQTLGEVENWISVNVTRLAGCQVRFSVKYLGTYLGPRALSLIWAEATAKYTMRCEAAVLAAAPIALALRFYASRAISVLAYLLQFYLPE